RVLVRVPNADGSLHIGGGGSAVVRLTKPVPTTVVPDSALVQRGGGFVVFVVGADSVAHARVVVMGVRSAGRIALQSGVRAGERVVTTGAYGLEDGMHVVPQRVARP